MMDKERMCSLQEKLVGQKVVNIQNEEGYIKAFDFARDSVYMFVTYESRTAQYLFPSVFYNKFVTLFDNDLAKEAQLLGEEDALDKKRVVEEKKKKAEEEKALRKKKEEERYKSLYSSFSSWHENASFKRRVVEPTRDKGIVFTEEQQAALDIMNDGNNVFLSGSAGSGKSAILREYIYINRDKNIITCAPTGIAAINVEGETIHKAFNIDYRKEIHPGDYNPNVPDVIIEADVIIIDEISMCRFDLFEYLIKTIRAAEMKRNEGILEQASKEVKTPELYPNKQIILVGDFYQLPPVIDNKEKIALEKNWGSDYPKEGFAFQSPLWDELNLTNIILHESKRQNDAEFLYHLDNIRLGEESSIQWFNSHAKTEPIDDALYIMSKNKDVEAINAHEIEKLSGESREYVAVKEGEVSHYKLPVESRLLLKIGMRVIILANNGDIYQNGLLGTVEGFGSDYVIVHLDNGDTVNVYAYTWNAYEHVVKGHRVEKEIIGTLKQIPLKAAYAVTIHKAQGQTYDYLNLNPYCFNPGQLYVALSRVRDIRHLALTQPINKNDLQVSTVVKEFYDNIENANYH